MESLEDRRVLAVLTVNTTADTSLNDGDNLLSLREAIMVVNNGVPTGLSGTEQAQITGDDLGTNDTIVFSVVGEINLVIGELEITSDVQIIGPNSTQLEIDASSLDATPNENNGDGGRIFNISASDLDVSISRLTLTGGDVDGQGGAIYASDGNLSLSDLVVEHNAAGSGGGLSARAGANHTILVNSVTFEDNHAEPTGAVTSSYGGAIEIVAWDGAEVRIVGSQIKSNVSSIDGGGIHILSGGPFGEVADFEISDSIIAGNKAIGFGSGGGVYLVMEGDTDGENSRLIRCAVYDNVAYGGGGGLALRGGSVEDTPTNYQVFQIESCTINGNVAFSLGTSATWGGGGVFINLGANDAEILNTTISGNRALSGGGIGIAGSPAPVAIRHSTITENKAGPFESDEYADVPLEAQQPKFSFGGGVYFWTDANEFDPGDYSPPLFDHTIVWGNTHVPNDGLQGDPPHNHQDWNLSPDLGAWPPPEATSVHFSLTPLVDPLFTFDVEFSIIGAVGPSWFDWNVFDFNNMGSQIGTTDVPITGVNLQPLADNGGFLLPDGSVIKTHALGPASIAIDAGNPLASAGVGTVPEFDQRDDPFDRIYDDIIDIGAFEKQPIPCVLYGDYNEDGKVNAADYVIWRRYFSVDPNFDLPNEGPGASPGVVDMADYDVWRANFDRSCGVLPSGQSIFMLTVSSDDSNSDYDFNNLSLREALELAADEENYPGEDLIVFAPWVNTITLSDELVIDSDVTLEGPGADDLTIEGSGTDRVILVDYGVTATISGMTITGGYADYGGGIAAVGTTTLDSVRVTGNHATIDGGGVYAYGNTTIKSSRIDGNSAAQGGGGLYVNATGATTVTDTTIDGGNEALYGAGIYGLLGGPGFTLTVENSTIADNTAVGIWSFGGGMLLRAYTTGAAALVANSTVSGNEAAYNGGIRAQDGVALVLANDTIAFNQGTGGSGLEATSGTNVVLFNTIVSENSGASNYNASGTFNGVSRYNLIGVGNNSSISNGTLNNIVLTSGTAGLAALSDNGGPTKTHALLSGSAAIDAGWDSIASAYNLAFDQRGEGFDRILDGGIDGNIDIGAFEFD